MLIKVNLKSDGKKSSLVQKAEKEDLSAVKTEIQRILDAGDHGVIYLHGVDDEAQLLELYELYQEHQSGIEKVSGDEEKKVLDNFLKHKQEAEKAAKAEEKQSKAAEKKARREKKAAEKKARKAKKNGAKPATEPTPEPTPEPEPNSELDEYVSTILTGAGLEDNSAAVARLREYMNEQSKLEEEQGDKFDDKAATLGMTKLVAEMVRNPPVPEDKPLTREEAKALFAEVVKEEKSNKKPSWIRRAAGKVGSAVADSARYVAPTLKKGAGYVGAGACVMTGAVVVDRVADKITGGDED